MSALGAAFGLGALLGGKMEPLLPIEAAWGIAASGPILATGLTHGVCSVNAARPVLAQLTASRLGEVGTASALACSLVLICAPLGAACLPMVLLISPLPASFALTAWLTGSALAPGITLYADSLFPARLPAEANGRIRQHPLASLLAAVLTLACGLAVYSALQAGVTAFITIIACAVASTVSVLTVRLPRGAR